MQAADKALERYIVRSDDSEFVGRIFDFSIVSLNFDSNAEISNYSDAKYALNVNDRTTLLTLRVDSLNHIGDLLWPKAEIDIHSLPTTSFEYCNIIQDVFLMRLISVLDCCCMLTVAVFELDLPLGKPA